MDYSTFLSGFLSAKDRAQRELGMSVELICCFLRHLPVPESLAVFNDEEVQKSFAAGQVIGIGIDSSEMNFPPHLYSEIYSKAKHLNLKRTAHAGEVRQEIFLIYISFPLCVFTAYLLCIGRTCSVYRWGD
jgi:adenosine deaminase